MSATDRRQFLRQLGLAGFAPGLTLPEAVIDSADEVLSPLHGQWEFRTDRAGAPVAPAAGYKPVAIPHTWQVEAETADYLGVAWYRKSFTAPEAWEGKWVRLEFEAVYHSARVFLNGQLVGEHLRKGYTAFTVDLTPALRIGQENVLAVRVDNAFDRAMLPRGNSFDWTPDGGIYRPVNLLVTPPVFVTGTIVEAVPSGPGATINLAAGVRNAGRRRQNATISATVIDDETGRAVLTLPARRLRIEPGEQEITFEPVTLTEAKRWHFDHPHLYRVEVTLSASGGADTAATTFGVREFTVRDGSFVLNGEKVRLFGVERMAGSHPDFGMAEPAEWIEHDHDDMKALNCVFTRVHWMQDRRLLDYCDRNGILIQLEVPTWGPDTFSNMSGEPNPEILRNGLEQLREMIARDRNHPSVFAWGLCNEINGQNPPAAKFALALYEEAKRLNPGRLCTYASNSLQNNPERDLAAARMDFISWNEYYESWYGGNVERMEQNLLQIHQAFPDRPIVVSEYGYCECTADRLGGDAERIDILETHTAVYNRHPFVGGAIFFSYNDYRTHIGDKGLGVMKQRVHGVVDLYGNRKPSFEALRNLASPIEKLDVTSSGDDLTAALQVRNALPAHQIEGYRLRWVVYGFGDLPMEKHEAALPTLNPGESTSLALAFAEKKPSRVVVDVLRPTGFSARTETWTPPA